MKVDTYFKQLPKNLTKNLDVAKRVILRDMHDSSDRYVPEDTGRTRLESKIKDDYVMWENPYVEKIYWGIDPRTGKQLNIKTVKNPTARSKWIDKSIEVDSQKWTNTLADIMLQAF